MTNSTKLNMAINAIKKTETFEKTYFLFYIWIFQAFFEAHDFHHFQPGDPVLLRPLAWTCPESCGCTSPEAMANPPTYCPQSCFT